MSGFKCDRCGLCCRNLDKSELYADLNKGSGVCKYLDESTDLCMIYENRPLKCNIDKAFEVYFHKFMTLEAYYTRNYEACRALKGAANTKF